jgi:hypothetical protein
VAGTDAQPAPEARPSEDRAADATEWRRAAGLFALLVAFSTVRPAVLVGIPFVLLVLALPLRRPVALVLAAGATFLALMGAERSGLWYAERGWAVLVAGWFAALTVRWPGTRFLSRGLAALAGAAGVTAAFLVASPGAWRVLDWSVAERMREGVATALDAVRVLRGGEAGLSPALVATVHQAAETQAHLFPALLALGSLAGLGVAWWMYVRLGLGVHGALAPVRRFRFNDQLVWLFVGGLVLLVAGLGEGWTRAGSNTVVFMGALYALRGAAVVLFVNGGISVLGLVVLGFGMLFLAPVILVGALFIGLGDTWLDLRAKAASRAA